MDLEDLFKLTRGRGARKHGDDHHRFPREHHTDRDDRFGGIGGVFDRARRNDRDHSEKLDISSVLRPILQSRGLIIAALVVLLLLGPAGLVIVLAILPFIESTFAFLFENGLSGVVDTVVPYAEKVWKGSN